MAVHQFLDELYALVFHHLRVLPEVAIERHADFPWPREDLGVLHRRFIIDRVPIDERVPLDDLQRLAVKISGPIEPRLIDLIGDIYHDRIALPPPARPAHPAT